MLWLALIACSTLPAPSSVVSDDTAAQDTADADDTGENPAPDPDTGVPLSGWDTAEPVDCDALPVDPGPFPSDAPAWRAEVVYPPSIPLPPQRLLEATYTADGRLLDETWATPETPTSTHITYRPGTNRIASLESLGFGGPYAETWSWSGNTATIDGELANTPVPTRQWTVRDDGLPIEELRFEASGIQTVTTDYLTPTSWQVVSTTSTEDWSSAPPLVHSWDWACLTSTEVLPSGVRVTRYHPDGRVRFTGSGPAGQPYTATGSWRYVGDTWRLDYIVHDGPQGVWVLDWVWTEL